MGARLTRTVIPVLGGFAPGVTATFRRVVSPGETEAGTAEPMPVGAVGAQWDATVPFPGDAPAVRARRRGAPLIVRDPIEPVAELTQTLQHQRDRISHFAVIPPEGPRR